MRITSFRDLAAEARALAKKASVAVVEAHDLHTLESVATAANDGIITPVLIGDREQIKRLLTQIGESVSNYSVVDSPGAENSMRMGAQ